MSDEALVFPMMVEMMMVVVDNSSGRRMVAKGNRKGVGLIKERDSVKRAFVEKR